MRRRDVCSQIDAKARAKGDRPAGGAAPRGGAADGPLRASPDSRLVSDCAMIKSSYAKDEKLLRAERPPGRGPGAPALIVFSARARDFVARPLFLLLVARREFQRSCQTRRECAARRCRASFLKALGCKQGAAKNPGGDKARRSRRETSFFALSTLYDSARLASWSYVRLLWRVERINFRSAATEFPSHFILS